jgi:transposase
MSGPPQNPRIRDDGLKFAEIRHMRIPCVVGFDDWSWLKGSRYGTIVVDLERRKVVGVLQDRSAKMMAA